MRAILVISIILICFISIVYLVVNFAFRNVILSPRKNKEQAFELLTKRKVYNVDDYKDLFYEKVGIQSFDNLKLQGYYFEKHKECKKVVIIVHGYTANHYISLQFLDMYFKEGFNVLLIDSRSHGDSEGIYVTYGIKEKEDIRSWVEFLRKRLGSHIEIGIHGQSMGAATCLMYAGKYNDVEFVVADCPYSNGKKILEYQFKTFGHLPPKPIYILVNKVIKKKCDFSMEDVSPIDDIKYTNVPILFIHGTLDKTIPYAMSEEMYKINKNNNSIFLVQEADHVECYAKDKIGYEKAVKGILESIKNRNENTV